MKNFITTDSDFTKAIKEVFAGNKASISKCETEAFDYGSFINKSKSVYVDVAKRTSSVSPGGEISSKDSTCIHFFIRTRIRAGVKNVYEVGAQATVAGGCVNYGYTKVSSLEDIKEAIRNIASA